MAVHVDKTGSDDQAAAIHAQAASCSAQSPIRTIWSPAIAISVENGVVPVPSTIRPPERTTSSMAHDSSRMRDGL